MEILTEDGIKKIYYKATLYPFVITEAGVNYRIHVIYNRDGNLKGFLLADAKKISFTDTDAIFARLLQEAPLTKLDYIKKVGEVKVIKSTTLKPSAKSGAKKGTTMIYVPNDWVELLGINSENSEVHAKMQGDIMIIKRKSN